jgi:hypothetical protein
VSTPAPIPPSPFGRRDGQVHRPARRQPLFPSGRKSEPDPRNRLVGPRSNALRGAEKCVGTTDSSACGFRNADGTRLNRLYLGPTGPIAIARLDCYSECWGSVLERGNASYRFSYSGRLGAGCIAARCGCTVRQSPGIPVRYRLSLPRRHLRPT